ncbi:Inner membrane ABC transporter permease protein ycjP [Chlamydia abortus]|uniref:Carbohydrate ABC transporter permease n=1 Tax=Paenibacillus residui TaxID=629724 RepID=A0ABW3DCG8_9BACL|nr:carbohydrate ABC transporter permease [Paenibacillus sp. 32O-W]SHE12343.1 Inner membrane ABC transporter permease protein ycjP [Chlamydia abortus]
MSTDNPKWAQGIIHLFFIIITLCMVVPLLLVVSISFSDEEALIRGGYKLFPEQFSLTAYQTVFKYPAQLLMSYGVTIFVTVVGTAAGLLLTAMIGYTISRRDYRYRRITTFYVFFTMLFSGGLVPFYIMMTKYLQLKDTIWVLIIPYLLNPFYVMIMKGFMDKMPLEVIESAKIDGANEWKIFFRIILPLATPALATVGLFIGFTYWNDWWLGLLFIDDEKLVPLQLLLYRTMNSIEFFATNAQYISGNIDLSQFPSLSTRMALALLGAGPMLFVFPFCQKYFVKGMTVGSLKE